MHVFFRRARSKNKVRPETRKQNADKHIRRNARVCKHAVSLKSLPESCWFIRTSFASLATFVPHSPTRDLQLTWTRWKALARHRHAQHTHTHCIWLTCPGTVWISLEWLWLSQTCLNSLRLPFIHLKWLGVTLLTLLTIFGLVEPFPRLQAYSSSLRPMQANSINLSDVSLWFAMICPGSTHWHLFVLIWTERD